MKRSCDFCHGRKLKCSGESPCENCVKRNLDCRFDREVLKPGPKRSSSEHSTLAKKKKKIQNQEEEEEGRATASTSNSTANPFESLLLLEGGELAMNMHLEPSSKDRSFSAPLFHGRSFIDRYFELCHPLLPILSRSWLLENYQELPMSLLNGILAMTHAFDKQFTEAQQKLDSALLMAESDFEGSSELMPFHIFLHLLISHVYTLLGHYDLARMHLGQCCAIAGMLKLERLEMPTTTSTGTTAALRIHEDLGKNFLLGLLYCVYFRDLENSLLLSTPCQFAHDLNMSDYPILVELNHGDAIVAKMHILEAPEILIPLVTKGRRMLLQRALFTEESLTEFLQELDEWFILSPHNLPVGGFLYILIFSQYYLIRIMASKAFLSQILLDATTEDRKVLQVKQSVNELIRIRSFVCMAGKECKGFGCTMSSRALMIGSLLGMLLGVSTREDLVTLRQTITPSKEKLFIKNALNLYCSINLVSLLL